MTRVLKEGNKEWWDSVERGKKRERGREGGGGGRQKIQEQTPNEGVGRDGARGRRKEKE
jgi:hypothetical protein